MTATKTMRCETTERVERVLNTVLDSGGVDKRPWFRKMSIKATGKGLTLYTWHNTHTLERTFPIYNDLVELLPEFRVTLQTERWPFSVKMLSKTHILTKVHDTPRQKRIKAAVAQFMGRADKEMKWKDGMLSLFYFGCRQDNLYSREGQGPCLDYLEEEGIVRASSKQREDVFEYTKKLTTEKQFFENVDVHPGRDYARHEDGRIKTYTGRRLYTQHRMVIRLAWCH